MYYHILLILGLLFANSNIIINPTRHQASEKTNTERTNPRDDPRDFIITELQTP